LSVWAKLLPSFRMTLRSEENLREISISWATGLPTQGSLSCRCGWTLLDRCL